MDFFMTVVADCTARRVLADKGLSSAANRVCLAKAGIMFRASRGHPLCRHSSRFNWLISRRPEAGRRNAEKTPAFTTVLVRESFIKLL